QQAAGKDDLEKSGTPEELIRLSIGLEGINDILADLDQAIAKATGNSEQIVEANSDVIKKLLSSPFSRKDGVVRKKVIAFLGADNESNETQKQAETLIELGFHVVSIGNETCSFTENSYRQLRSEEHLNSSHVSISYSVYFLKKKINK